MERKKIQIMVLRDIKTNRKRDRISGRNAKNERKREKEREREREREL